MNFTEQYNSLRNKFDDVFSSDDDFQDKLPKEGDKRVSPYINALWDDALKYFKYSFAKSKKDALVFGYSNPEDFWNALDKLENNQHWEVYGRRKGGNDDWKQELIDGEIQDQLRARCSFITANWHDITITPNLKGINDILDQERKSTGWGQNVTEWVKFAQKYGFVWVRSILDKTDNPNGVATEILCPPGSILRTPNTKSIKKIDGCWYLIHAQQVNDNWVSNNYPKLDITTVDRGEKPKFLQIDNVNKDESYTHTKMLNKLEAFLDDETLEEIPFSKEEFENRVGELMANIQAGEQNSVAPLPEDNHKKFVKAYIEWLEEKVNFYEQIVSDAHSQGLALLQEDVDLINSVVGHVSEQIFSHEKYLEEEKAKSKLTKIPVGKRKKYPFGRYIVTIDGVTAEDGKNPYENDWRKLFHYLPNERVPNRDDGRGDVEILWNDNFVLDTMLSRFADDGLLSTIKKPYFKVGEKKRIEEEGYNNDPTIPGYYEESPPIFPNSGASNNQYIQSYQIAKNNIKQKLGINETTYGKRVSSNESGKHAELMLSQNATIVTGELNQNLNDVIEDIVETRIMLWKTFYTEPRIFQVDGEEQSLVLAEYLRQQEIVENGQTVYKDMPAIQVSVRPDSNFPNKVESEIQTLLQLHDAMPDDVPVAMILDYVANRFPALAKSGKYRKENEFAKIGKEVVAKQQQDKLIQEKNAQKPLEDVKRKVQNRMTTEAAKQIAGSNGI